MGYYGYEIRQALREIAQEMKRMRRTIESIDKRLAAPGGLTAATTRKAHLIVDGDKLNVYCSACGKEYGTWGIDIDEMTAEYQDVCDYCGAVLKGDAEFVSGSGNE